MKDKNVSHYNRLYEMYAGDMFAYGMSFNMGKDIVLDAIHDVFLHILEKQNTINEQQNARFYLLVSLRNRLFSMKRKEIPFQSIDDPESTNFSIFIKGLEDSIEDDEDKNEIINRIETIMNELTSKQREVIYLRYMQNLSYDEIAQILQISPKAVRKLTLPGNK